jgi:hypothetical protein
MTAKSASIFMRSRILISLSFLAIVITAAADDLADEWRAAHRIIDLHQHVDYNTQHLARAVKIMDAVGLGTAVDLDGGTVTKGRDGGISAFERNKTLADTLYPGRFLHYMHLDYTGWDEPDFTQRAVKQIEEGHRLGAAGFKVSVLLTPCSRMPGLSAKMGHGEKTNRAQAPDAGAARKDSSGLPQQSAFPT